MKLKVAALAAVGMLLAGQASAADAALAQISAIKGQVLVSQQGKLVPASAGALRAGDRVVAKDGQASIKFADGCAVTLKPQAMATISETSPCANGAGLVKASGGDSAQFFGLTGMWPVVAVVGGLALIVLIAEGDDEDTVSP